MKVLLAEHAGACYGVQRALRLAALEADGAGRTQTLGPLIHNPQVVEKLARGGVHVAEGVDDIDADCVVIRSHGVTPQVRRQVDALGVRVVDATCPHVIRAQKAAAQLASAGILVLVVGEPTHPEVQGLVAHAREAGGEVKVVADVSQVPCGLEGPVGVVVQTTQPHEALDQVVAALRRRGIDPQVRDTICSATSHRQQAARALAGQVDAMVVIGGHNSSNTTRLYEICASQAPRAFHVETPGELQREQFGGCATVGVTAGASTPEDQIAEVVALLESW